MAQPSLRTGPLPDHQAWPLAEPSGTLQPPPPSWESKAWWHSWGAPRPLLLQVGPARQGHPGGLPGRGSSGPFPPRPHLAHLAPPPHSWLGLSLRLWYRELFKYRVPPEPPQAGGARTFHPHVAGEEPEAQQVRGHKPTRWDHAQCSEPSSPPPPTPTPAPGPLSASAPLSVSRSLPPRRQVPQARHGPGPAPEAA